MEYVQERVTTLHDLTGQVPDVPCSDAAVVVPMTARERGRPAAEQTLATLASVAPRRVIVPVRSPAAEIGAVREWLEGFDVETQLLWCNGPAVEALLEDALDRRDGGARNAGRGVNGASDADGEEASARDGDCGGNVASDVDREGSTHSERGKGTDVWLGLGVAAAQAPYVVVHDADATTYDAATVPRLLAPVAEEFEFAKGYYARVEDDGLYGRLFRLFYEPLLETLARRHDASVLGYLSAFRYALAGEFAATADIVRSVRAQRAWGLEVGTLGEAFRVAGAAGTAQVDLGVHRHDHRRVEGDGGLASMSRQVGAALFRVLADHDVDPEYDALPAAYRETAADLIEQYAADARHNGLPYDRAAEQNQVAAYAEAIAPPGPDDRLPAWRDAPLEPAEVVDAAERSLAGAPPASR